MASRFVTATDEVWRLQNGAGPECRFFQAMANEGHYRTPGGTRQGIYICSPSGRLLASINSLEVTAVCETLRTGLRAWESLPAEARRLPPDFDPRQDFRWERQVPPNGLILESASRDLSMPPEPTANRSGRWNRDHVWFSADEARQWLPKDLAAGAGHQLPDELVQRLVRFHLVDNVRGQTLPFTARDAAGSTIAVEVLGRMEGTVDLRISGATRATSGADWDMAPSDWKPEPDHPRGVVTRLLGRATYDVNAETFTRFDLVAVGYRWGFSTNNARREQPELSPIGFAFTLLPSDSAPSIPPAFIDVYNAQWLARPDSAIRNVGAGRN